MLRETARLLPDRQFTRWELICPAKPVMGEFPGVVLGAGKWAGMGIGPRERFSRWGGVSAGYRDEPS